MHFINVHIYFVDSSEQKKVKDEIWIIWRSTLDSFFGRKNFAMNGSAACKSRLNFFLNKQSEVCTHCRNWCRFSKYFETKKFLVSFRIGSFRVGSFCVNNFDSKSLSHQCRRGPKWPWILRRFSEVHFSHRPAATQNRL